MNVIFIMYFTQSYSFVIKNIIYIYDYLPNIILKKEKRKKMMNLIKILP